MGNDGATNELYRNNGGGNFTLVLEDPNNEVVTYHTSNTHSVAWGDMDGDGDLVTQWRSPNALLCTCARGPPSARA